MQCSMMYSSRCRVKEGHWESEINFYKSYNSPFYQYKKYPFCKHCLKEYIGDYVFNEERVVNVCRILDIAFIKSVYVNCKEFSDYLKVIASSYKDMTFNDSAFEDESLDEFTEEDLMSMKLKWGEGYVTSEYLFLTNEFNNMMNAYEVTDYIQESYFQEICITKLMIQRERRKDNPNTKDLIKQYNDLVTMANLKPATNKTDGKTFSEKIRTIETTKPIIKDDESTVDVDKFGYFKKYFVKHFSRVLEVDDGNEANRNVSESDT